MEERSALLRIAVLCRLLTETLDELELDLPTAQLVQELAVLREDAERQLSQ